MNGVALHCGDCRDILPTLAPVDACVTDPPYELGFMGKRWDSSGVAFQPETWRAVLDVLKPGAHLLAFGGTRTFHRMVCAIEDAGFEIRDTIMWLYGTGFPKSHNLPGGLGTALKPAHEPIIVARKPLVGTVAANVLAHGTGALNIDACRVPHNEECRMMAPQAEPDGRIIRQAGRRESVLELKPAGRWPANVIHDGSDEVLAAFAAYGERTSGTKRGGQYRRADGGIHEGGQRWDGTACYADTGTAARFFYSAKASKADRAGSKHPTVKPIALMRYLCRLVTPPGGTVLDPFAGSGTTLQAAREEGFSAVGIELDLDYQTDIRRRLGRETQASLLVA